MAKRKSNFQRREMFLKAEVRASENDDKQKVIDGVIPYNKRAEIWGFMEVIKPGAFSKSLKERDVKALWNHSPQYILGRSDSGRLSFEDKADGLHFSLVIPEQRQYALDLYDVVSSGDADGVSFGFRTIKATWIEEEGEPDVRELEEVELFEISVGVTFPAYHESKAQARALDEITGLDISKLAHVLVRSRNDGITTQEKEFLGQMIDQIRSSIDQEPYQEPGDTHSETEEPAKTTLRKRRLDLLEKSF